MAVSQSDNDTKTVFFTATVAKVQTLSDLGIRVTFDMPETAIYAAAWLMTCKAAGMAIDLTLAQHEWKGKTEAEVQSNGDGTGAL